MVHQKLTTKGRSFFALSHHELFPHQGVFFSKSSTQHRKLDILILTPTSHASPELWHSRSQSGLKFLRSRTLKRRNSSSASENRVWELRTFFDFFFFVSQIKCHAVKQILFFLKIVYNYIYDYMYWFII